MSFYRGGSDAGGGMQIAVPPVTPMVKNLLIVLAAAFLVQTLLVKTGFGSVVAWLSLYPPAVVSYFALWQLVTYALLHGGVWHLAMNCLGLWMLGGDVERFLGSRGFLKYFVICVFGGGLLHTLFGLLSAQPRPVIGASAGVLGIVLAFAMFFPQRQLFIFPLPFPIRARTFALIFGAIELFSAIDANPGDSIAHFAHLGGMAAGYLYIKFFLRRGGGGGTFGLFRTRGRFRRFDEKRGGPFDLH